MKSVMRPSQSACGRRVEQKILVTGKTRDSQVPLTHSWRTGGFRAIIAI